MNFAITLNCLALMLGGCLLQSAYAADSTPFSGNPEWRYTVRPGDTIIGVSKRYLIDAFQWSQIQKYNTVINPRRLKPGQTLRIPLSLLKQKPVPATLQSISGNVAVLDQAGLKRVAQINELLNAGTQIQTAENSSATLKFADGSLLTVQPNTSIQLDTMSIYEGGGMVDTKVRLQKGRAEVLANPNKTPHQRMLIITPSAVAAVRGTHFRVSAESATTREETTEGKVSLEASGSKVELETGFGSIAETGKPPSAPVQLLAAPNTSLLPNLVERLPMRFDLAENAQAKAWLGQIASDKEFNEILLEKLADKPRLTFADLPDGQYVLRVRAEDSLGLQGLDALHPFELNARPFFPLLTSPKAKGEVRNAQAEFSWTKMEGAKQYRFILAEDTEFKKVIQETVTESTTIKPDKPLLPQAYFWRVASIDMQEQGPFSDAQMFTYKPLPNAPKLDESSLVFSKDQMAITLPTPADGLHYELELAQDTARKQVLWQGSSKQALTKHGSVIMPRPNSGKVYLSMRTVEEDGTAGPFATQELTVPKQTHYEMLFFLLPLLAM